MYATKIVTRNIYYGEAQMEWRGERIFMSEAVAKGGAFKWGHSYISVTFEGNKEIH